MAYTTINKGSSYFNTKLYTGTGATQSITGVGFQPDWTWTKVRNTSGNHREQDSVRGTGSELYPNLTNAEATGVTTAITSWTSDGYNIGTDTGINTNGNTYVSWNWLGANTTVSNTSGTITSTVSANTTSGFSIVSYTNPASGSPFTVGHGLGVAPKMIIVKTRNVAQTWGVWHTSIGFGNYLRLDSTAVTAAANLVTATSSTTFSTYQNHHATSDTLIAYCFAEVKGYSKFSSFTGNGSFDGTFVYTGFKPAFVIIKCTDTARSWQIHNNKSDSFNKSGSTSTRLFSNLSDAEAANTDFDLLSNGFKVRGNDLNFNGSGNNYIYMAFAENPFVSSKGIPTTAR
jgi:hypothetical protein